MTDNTRNRDDLWDEDVDDNEQTQVAINPLYRSSVPPSADPSRSHPRHVSSFGVPKSARPSEDQGVSGRPSLYDRLVQSGALDESIIVEANLESARPLDDGLSRQITPELPPPPDLRELAEALEGRDSTEELRPSDLDVVAVLPSRTIPPAGSRSLANLPRPIPAANVPSILLGPGASTRNDVTERFSHMPSTHPLANSISPTAHSVRPPPVENGMSMWHVAAAALLLIGFGGAIGGYRSRVSPAAERSAQPVAPRPVSPASVAALPPAMPRAEAMPTDEVADELAAAPSDPAVSAADEAPALEALSDEARRRERRHAERAARALLPEPQALPTEAAVGVAGEPAAMVPVAGAQPARPTPVRSQPAVLAEPLLAQPSREQVVATMDGVVAELAKCVGDKHGEASVTMTVRSAGSVSYALVGGTFAGTPEGSCIARVIKQARFPAFSDASIRVSYPFQL